MLCFFGFLAANDGTLLLFLAGIVCFLSASCFAVLSYNKRTCLSGRCIRYAVVIFCLCTHKLIALSSDHESMGECYVFSTLFSPYRVFYSVKECEEFINLDY